MLPPGFGLLFDQFINGGFNLLPGNTQKGSGSIKVIVEPFGILHKLVSRLLSGYRGRTKQMFRITLGLQGKISGVPFEIAKLKLFFIKQEALANCFYVTICTKHNRIDALIFISQSILKYHLGQ